MPKFELIPLAEAKLKTASGKRAQILAEYLDYVRQLKGEEAGRLRASEGETVSTVRRRLGAAGREAGKDLTIKRVGDELYFWTGEPRKRRRGRPAKNS